MTRIAAARVTRSGESRSGHPTAIFDVDGTLTDTNHFDEERFVAAVLAELGCEVGARWGGVEDA